MNGFGNHDFGVEHSEAAVHKRLTLSDGYGVLSLGIGQGSRQGAFNLNSHTREGLRVLVEHGPGDRVLTKSE